MNKEQLQNLLNQKYDAANWNKIYGSIFPNVMLFSSPKEIAVTENWVKSFKQRGLVRLQGNQDVAIFEVVLKDGISVQSKRVGLRNLVAKLIDEYQNHGVLAVFDNGSPEYRFTFAAKETKVTIEGIEKTETDSKRYTYILGETETCKTAAEQFIKLSEKGSTISLSDLQEAFSVEKLSKQFFNEYKEQYNYFVSYLASQPKILKSVFADDEKRMRDFIKLLLGRLVFLQFVQKKRWLGVPAKNTDWSSGDVKFLVNTYRAFSKKEKYYSDFLEELFFECLNSPNRKNELFSITGTKVPFLNGGLFENDNPKTKNINFPVNYFDGLFDFFGRYNFTIDENDPTEKEVGIDPEMLGSIFENLLEDNKDKGAFYTPKEIVHYMCQESLIEYLCTKVNVENDEKVASSIRNLIIKRKIDECVTGLIKPIAVALREVKICDPAIGSGAFPMGMLMEIFHCVFELYNADPKAVSKEWNMNGWQANVVKSNIIQNSIYGVDIEKGAVDIARLRFWLSLIVDEEEPKALPNLDYKIVVGNSLVSKLGDDIIDIDWEVKANTEAAKKLQQEIQNNLNKLFKTQKVFFDFNGKKENLKEEIRNLKIDVLISQLQLDKYKYGNSSAQIGSLFEMTAKERNIEQERKQKLAGFDKTIKELQKLKVHTDYPLNYFDWKLDFPEVMNEQVTTNVGFDIVIGNPPYVFSRDNLSQIEKDNYNKLYKLTQFKINLYILFIEKGYSLLNKNSGVFFYITPNNWLTLDTNSDLREFILSKTKNIKILQNYANVFESASVDTVILGFKNNGQSSVDYLEWVDKKPIILNKKPTSDYLSKNKHIISYDGGILNKKSFLNDLKGVQLQSICDVKNGVQAYTVGEGTPVCTVEMKNNRVYHSLTDKGKNWFKYLDGVDVCRYYLGWSGQYIKYGKNLSRPRQEDLFIGERILVRQIPSQLPYCINACFLDEHCINDNNSMIVKLLDTNYSLKYILGLLNSKLLSEWFAIYFGKLSRKIFPQFKINEFRIFPIAKASKNSQKQIELLVSNVLNLKNKNKDTSSIETEIDNLVYKLYELTYDEVKVIDPEFELSKDEYDKIELK